MSGSAVITAQTRLAAVIGWPVRHSLSPVLHNAAFAACEIDAVYVAMPVPPGEAAAAVNAMRSFDLLGYSITMPHKADVIPACDSLTDAARSLGAVNCVYRSGDEIIGDNTDGAGFVAGVEHDFGRRVQGMKVAVLGAGGAARAVIRELADCGAVDIAVVNRSADRAKTAADAGGNRARVADATALSDADLIVNATPLGMADTDASDAVPCDVNQLRADAIVSDLIYHPLETPLLAAARARGLRSQNGVSMLVHQAAAQFERWTGKRAPVESMVAAATAAIS